MPGAFPDVANVSVMAEDFVHQRAVLVDIFYCLKTLCRLGARVTPRPKVAGFCAAQWPDFIPPLTSGVTTATSADAAALAANAAFASSL